MNVLYFHPASVYGGAAKSLIELFKLLRKFNVNGTVVTPKGAVCQAFVEVGLNIFPVKGLSQFDHTRYGYYRGLRWIILFRELFFLPYSLLALWQLKKQSFDLIHLNEITLLPIGLLAKWLLKIPLVVHVRSVQLNSNKAILRTKIINRLLKQYADAVIAIDQSVACTLFAALPLKIIHNGLYVNKPQFVSTNAVVCVGFLGNLLRFRGIYELIEAVRILVKERKLSVKLLIVGENVRYLVGLKAYLLKQLGFAEDVKSEITKKIQQYDLEDFIELRGFVADVHQIYAEIDILAFPSYLNTAGRPVFEAALYGIPSVVAVSSPLPDAIIHNQTGIAIESPDPILLADVLEELITNTDLRQYLGNNAKIWAEKIFSIEQSAEMVNDIYKKIVSDV